MRPMTGGDVAGGALFIRADGVDVVFRPRGPSAHVARVRPHRPELAAPDPSPLNLAKW